MESISDQTGSSLKRYSKSEIERHLDDSFAAMERIIICFESIAKVE